METGPLGFSQLLENGALGLKKEGTFSTEFSSGDLDGLIKSMLKQSEEEMKKQGVAASIKNLNVEISNGKGTVSTALKASKKVGFMNPSVDINAAFGLENVVDSDGRPCGKLQTTKLEVTPETLFMVVRPKEFLAPYIEGEKVNDTFKSVIEAEMDRRGAKVTALGLEFTPLNKLKITAVGSAK